MRYHSLIMALVLVSFSCLEAQEPTLVEPGMRVRVSTAPQGSRAEWTVGTVITVTADTLSIRADTDTAREIQVVRPAVTRLQVSRGEGSKARTGLALGSLAGAGAGGAIGYAALHDGYDLAPRDAALVGAVPGAVIGGLVGLGIGSGARRERWQDIRIAAASGFRHPVGLSFNVRFQTR